MKDNKRDLTVGSVGSKLMRFALPIVGINLLQAIYNLVDMIIVGHVCGSAGMSAVSIGGQITFFVLSVCSGIANGGSVYMGQAFGARKLDDSKSIVGTLLGFLIILALALTAIVIAVRAPFLKLLNTPLECFSEAGEYLTICMIGTVFVYVNEGMNGLLRGVGNSFAPMLFVLITTTENLLLDILFVAVFKWGVAGAAWATIICQCTSMVLVALYTARKTDLFDFRLSSFKICPKKLKEMLKIGLPQSFQFISTNISFLLVSALINSFGVSAAAAAGAANKIGTFGCLAGKSLMSAQTTLTAQSCAKKDFHRAIQGMWICIGASLAASVVFFTLCEIMPFKMYSLFTPDASVAQTGEMYLRLYAISFLDEVIVFCMNGTLAGAGYTLVSMIGSVSAAFGVRYVAAYWLSKFTALRFAGIGLGYSLAPLVGMAIAGGFLLSGRWKKEKIKIGA